MNKVSMGATSNFTNEKDGVYSIGITIQHLGLALTDATDQGNDSRTLN